MLVITKFQLIYPDWRGYLLSGFSLVWVANFYMSLFRRLRLDIKKQKTDVELKEEMLDEKKAVSKESDHDNPDLYREEYREKYKKPTSAL